MSMDVRNDVPFSCVSWPSRMTSHTPVSVGIGDHYLFTPSLSVGVGDVDLLPLSLSVGVRYVDI